MKIVFDLDGTLADGKHREHHLAKSPKDWDAYFEACDGDTPIRHVVQVFLALTGDGHYVEVWSGRSEGKDDSLRHKTLKWLLDECGILGTLEGPHGRGFARLLMRSHGDRRPDVELKREWLNDARATDCAPDLVFDDRDSVVAMWRAEGIPCFQVAPGDF